MTEVQDITVVISSLVDVVYDNDAENGFYYTKFDITELYTVITKLILSRYQLSRAK